VNFLGIGLPEIVLILVLTLIVVGPQRLPEMAVQLARLIRQLRGYASQVSGQLREEMGDLMQDYEALRGELRELREELRQSGQPLRDAAKAIDTDLRSAGQALEGAAKGLEDKPAPAKPSAPAEE
jgi:sec-independent protein translocase protein TatB